MIGAAILARMKLRTALERTSVVACCLAFFVVAALTDGCTPSLRRAALDLVLDVGCIVRNAELGDGERERICAVAPGDREEASKIAGVARVESRRFAASRVEASRCAPLDAGQAGDAGNDGGASSP